MIAFPLGMWVNHIKWLGWSLLPEVSWLAWISLRMHHSLIRTRRQSFLMLDWESDLQFVPFFHTYLILCATSLLLHSFFCSWLTSRVWPIQVYLLSSLWVLAYTGLSCRMETQNHEVLKCHCDQRGHSHTDIENHSDPRDHSYSDPATLH